MSIVGRSVAKESDVADRISSVGIFSFHMHAIIEKITNRACEDIPCLIGAFVIINCRILQKISACEKLGIETLLIKAAVIIGFYSSCAEK